MARPQRNTVDYFPFLCEEGKKMFYLEETYGNDGFAVFVKLLRELAKTDYHYLDLSKKTTLMFLSAKCKVSVSILESIINDLVELEKFDSELWDNNRIIWCQDFINSIRDAYKKRANKCITRNELLILLDGLGVRKLSKSTTKQANCTLKGSTNPQSKVKERKVNKKKEEYEELLTPPPNEKTKQELMKEREEIFKRDVIAFNTYPTDLLKDFFLYWSEPNKSKTRMLWETKPTFDIGRRLSTWARKDKNFSNGTYKQTNGQINGISKQQQLEQSILNEVEAIKRGEISPFDV